jgi:hypothetical protein
MTERLRRKKHITLRFFPVDFTTAKKWGRVAEAAVRSGLPTSEIFRLVADKKVESFLFKSRPENISGRRMVNLLSLDAYLDSMALEAAEQEAEAHAQAEASAPRLIRIHPPNRHTPKTGEGRSS